MSLAKRFWTFVKKQYSLLKRPKTILDLDKEGHGINMMELILITLISGLDLSDSDDDATWDPSKEREANNSRSRYVNLHFAD